jgi:hypothetical protein
MAKQKKTKLTADERKAVEKQIADLQAALEEQEEAVGAEASAEAEEDVEAQREALASLFDRLEITEADYDLLAGAFATGTEERTRQIVREELAAEEEQSGAGAGDGSVAELEDNPAAPAVDPPPPDNPPPPSKHWTEKRLFGKGEEAAN